MKGSEDKMANDIAKKLGLKPEQLREVAANLGFQIVDQTGYFKVLGPTGRQLYIGRGKVCTRVDLSGFTFDQGTKVPDQGVFGNVKQQMDWAGCETAEDVFRRLGTILEHLKSLAPVEPKPKKEKAAKAPKAAGGETQTGSDTPAAQMTPEERAARLDLIKKVAAEKGVDVSDKAVEALSDGATQPAAES